MHLPEHKSRRTQAMIRCGSRSVGDTIRTCRDGGDRTPDKTFRDPPQVCDDRVLRGPWKSAQHRGKAGPVKDRCPSLAVPRESDRTSGLYHVSLGKAAVENYVKCPNALPVGAEGLEPPTASL